jgi:hypothetical protein
MTYHKKALAIHEELNDRLNSVRDCANYSKILYKERNSKEALEYVSSA